MKQRCNAATFRKRGLCFVPDYSVIDFPPIIAMLFYPRRDFTPCPENAFDLEVPVEEDILIATRFYAKGLTCPTILYFHGNGEVVYDYDYIAPVYNDLGLNLVVADYRGYGASTGSPSFGATSRDAGVILQTVLREMDARGYQDDLWVMGRSLGSLSALELAANQPERLKGLIIESGFANVVRVMKRLGHFPEEVNLPQFDRECLEMVQSITIPALVLHGDRDQIVAHSEGEFIFENLGSPEKNLLTINNAGHNDIMYVGIKEYFSAIVSLIKYR